MDERILKWLYNVKLAIDKIEDFFKKKEEKIEIPQKQSIGIKLDITEIKKIIDDFEENKHLPAPHYRLKREFEGTDLPSDPSGENNPFKEKKLSIDSFHHYYEEYYKDEDAKIIITDNELEKTNFADIGITNTNNLDTDILFKEYENDIINIGYSSITYESKSNKDFYASFSFQISEDKSIIFLSERYYVDPLCAGANSYYLKNSKGKWRVGRMGDDGWIS